MLNKLILVLLPLVGCSTGYVKDTETYYTINLKPTITEVPAKTGKGRIVSVHNPFPYTLNISLECENETSRRNIVVPKNSESSFYIDTDKDMSMVCSIEHGWTLQ